MENNFFNRLYDALENDLDHLIKDDIGSPLNYLTMLKKLEKIYNGPNDISYNEIAYSLLFQHKIDIEEKISKLQSRQKKYTALSTTTTNNFGVIKIHDQGEVIEQNYKTFLLSLLKISDHLHEKLEDEIIELEEEKKNIQLLMNELIKDFAGPDGKGALGVRINHYAEQDKPYTNKDIQQQFDQLGESSNFNSWQLI